MSSSAPPPSIAVTPEAAEDLRRRHPGARIEEIPNGFEPELLTMRREPSGGTTILHSGTLTKDRPLAPLLAVLKPPLRLVLHGYVAPEIQKEIADSGAEVELVPPSGWEDAVRRIAEADVALVTQARTAGDETAVAAKVYEYLALGKPVLCITHGGATEALLRRLEADQLCARLDDRQSIEAALDRIRSRRPASARPAREARPVRAPPPGRSPLEPPGHARNEQRLTSPVQVPGTGTWQRAVRTTVLVPGTGTWPFQRVLATAGASRG